MPTLRVAVVGATGYAGAELVRILSGHPDAVVTVVSSRRHAGMAYDTIYPSMRGVVKLDCADSEGAAISGQADMAFLALPHKASMAMVPGLLDAGLRVVDLSADFRFKERLVYEAHYQPHACAHLLDRAVYGLCEVYGRDIQSADLIGNPGCYPTSVLLPLRPLIDAQLIDPTSIVADCKSGVSGAGREATAGTHYCHVNESFKPYKVGGHRHTPEIEAHLSRWAGRSVTVTFVPHLLPMTRGMESTIYAATTPGTEAAHIRQCLAEAYADKPFVRLLPGGRFPDTLHVKGTNFCDIGVAVDPGSGRLILMSAIDNLVKGAAGQAVQNMNLMFGFDETAGLEGIPYPL